MSHSHRNRRYRNSRNRKHRRQNRNRFGDISSEYVCPPRLQKQQAMDTADQYNTNTSNHTNNEYMSQPEPLDGVNNKRRQSFSDGEDEECTLSLKTSSESASNRSDNIYVHNNNQNNQVFYQRVPQQNIEHQQTHSNNIEDMMNTNSPNTPSSMESSETLSLMPNMNLMNNEMPPPNNAFSFPAPQHQQHSCHIHHQQENSHNNMYNMTPPVHQQEVDVECAATGFGHFDSAPCRIAMVDFYGDVLFDRIANVPNLVDPLTEFTGLTKWQIQHNGDPLQHVLSDFHDLLIALNKEYRFGVTVIGQSVQMDIVWTDLMPNIHYQRAIDIAHLFKTKNAKWDNYTFYSLREAAWALLDYEMNTHFHCPVEDAFTTIKLWRDFCLDPDQLEAAKNRLKKLKSCHFNHFPDFQVHTQFDQCSAMYNPSKCHCKQKTAVHIHGLKDLEKLRDLYLEHRSKPVLYDTM